MKTEFLKAQILMMTPSLCLAILVGMAEAGRTGRWCKSS